MPGNGRIEKTLTSDPLKLYLDVTKDFDAIRDKAQDLLWPENQDDARWADVTDRYSEQAGMSLAPSQRTRYPQVCRVQPRTLGRSWQWLCHEESEEEANISSDSRRVRARRQGSGASRVNPQNAGPAPRIHYAEDAPVSESSPQLKDQSYTTSARRVNFLVCDPSGQYQTGDPVTWTNKLVLRNQLSEKDGKRSVELFVAPKGDIRYSLDGREPRDGTTYEAPSLSGTVRYCCVLLPSPTDRNQKGLSLSGQGQERLGDRPGKTRPSRFAPAVAKLDSRAKTFEGLKQAADKSATFEGIVLNVGQR